MIDQIVNESKPKMKAALANLAEELKRIRTGRAHADILDGLFVSYYGSRSALREVATITIPEPTCISIKPWDRAMLAEVESAIRNSELGLNPVNDGSQVRLNLPPMTEERRKEITAQVKKFGEQTKVSLRNVRGDAWAKVQTGLKNKEVTEDDKYSAEDQLNKLIDEMNKEVEKMVSEKETEIMKI